MVGLLTNTFNKMVDKMEKYRVESGSVYELDEDYGAYVFCGKLNGRTLDEFIADIEDF